MVSRYGNIQDTVINQLYIYPVEQLDDIQVQRGYRIAGIYSIYRKPKVTYHSISVYCSIIIIGF